MACKSWKGRICFYCITEIGPGTSEEAANCKMSKQIMCRSSASRCIGVFASIFEFLGSPYANEGLSTFSSRISINRLIKVEISHPWALLVLVLPTGRFTTPLMMLNHVLLLSPGYQVSTCIMLPPLIP